MHTLIIVRHGESVWNKENIFTGWLDAPLSEKGIEDAKRAGKILKEKGFIFDMGFTSVLKRAYDTLDIVLKEMELTIPVERTWRLNERHYGWLQGKNKDEVRKRFGAEQVEKWRRGYEIRPPAKEKGDFRYPEVSEGKVPLTESLEDTEARLLPFWDGKIAPEIRKGGRVIIAAHGNSIRALVRKLEKLSPEEISKIEIPIGTPLVYELDNCLRPVNKYFLAV